MEKTSLVIGFNGGKATIVACGDVDTCFDAYRKEIDGNNFEFIGLLRKPEWYRRGKPLLVQKQKEDAHAKLTDELSKANEKAVEAVIEAEAIEEQLKKAEKPEPAKKAPKKKAAKKKAAK